MNAKCSLINRATFICDTLNIDVHRTMQECMTAATEQKIPGNCYPVDKVIHQDNIEIPAGL
ncbi:DUF1482 family protein [Escherichia coli]|nr:DUF1482 family protein [Escherichia coli]EHP5064209.1 DUF1482 family protein [Escherichia coli]